MIQTSAVNFGLLSENEQLAIISAFAGLLNSLSFMIQVVIRSKRLDISSYLKLLDYALSQQHNSLLGNMILHYRNFIESTIRENEVLDKKFYIIIPVSYLEMGIVKNVKNNFQKGLTLLMPRRDHIIRQLSRIGLRATQLQTKELIELFYDIYNEQSQLDQVLVNQTNQAAPSPPVNYPQQIPPVAAGAQIAAQQRQPTPPPPIVSQPVAAQPAPTYTPQTPSSYTQPNFIPPKSAAAPGQQAQGGNVVSRTGPFVVEELNDEYGMVR